MSAKPKAQPGVFIPALTHDAAVKLIGDLTRASCQHVLAANGLSRAKGAPARELKAALRLYDALTQTPLALEQKVMFGKDFLGW